MPGIQDTLPNDLTATQKHLLGIDKQYVGPLPSWFALQAIGDNTEVCQLLAQLDGTLQPPMEYPMPSWVHALRPQK